MRAASPDDRARERTSAHWHRYVATDGSLSGLRSFHARHRLLLLAHDPDGYRALRAVVADAPSTGLPAAHAAYAQRLERALAHRVSRAQHLAVLEHAARTLVDRLSVEERRNLTRVFRDYRRANVAFSVPQDLLRGMLHRVAPHSWVARQAYLDPGPPSLRRRPAGDAVAT